ALLHAARERCDGVEPGGCEHGGIVRRRKTRQDFWGNAERSLLPGFSGRGSCELHSPPHWVIRIGSRYLAAAPTKAQLTSSATVKLRGSEGSAYGTSRAICLQMQRFFRPSLCQASQSFEPRQPVHARVRSGFKIRSGFKRWGRALLSLAVREPHKDQL